MNQKPNLCPSNECTGCAACVNGCPKTAILLTENKAGFIMPEIDESKCINCGLCEHICSGRALQKQMFSEQKYLFGQSKNDDILMHTASGGIFSELAICILNHGGIVFGASLSMDSGVCIVKHRSIDCLQDLIHLQNSKYVQSDIGLTYKECQEYLSQNRLVLYSGTPCQIAGLKSFLRKDYQNLLTVDIICHGIPSLNSFNRYLSYQQERRKVTFTSIIFRDKKYGWGFKGKISQHSKNGHSKDLVWNSTVDSYYRMFLMSKIYRESCYSCHFACKNRTGDITLGDFWGGKSEIKKNTTIDKSKGVSCILINSPRGKRWLDSIESNLNIAQTKYEILAEENYQLVHPSKKPDNYEEIIHILSQEPYKNFERFFIKQQGIEYYRKSLIGLIPHGMKAYIKKLF